VYLFEKRRRNEKRNGSLSVNRYILYFRYQSLRDEELKAKLMQDY
jgi:hypothetical protein